MQLNQNSSSIKIYAKDFDRIRNASNILFFFKLEVHCQGSQSVEMEREADPIFQVR